MADNKYIVLKAVVNPLWVISDKMVIFAKTAGVFAVFLTLLSYIFGQTYACVFTTEHTESLYCLGNSLLYFPYLMIKMLIINIFVLYWLKKVMFNQTINKTAAAKSVGVFFLFIVANLLPLVSAFLLLVRKPNPVWQIEIVYFTIVSLGFLAPFVLMRFYAVLAGVINDNVPDMLKTVWKNTGGYTAKIVISAILVYLIVILTVISVNSVILRLVGILPLYIYNLTAEYVFNFMLLFVVTLIVNFINYQRQMFLK